MRIALAMAAERWAEAARLVLLSECCTSFSLFTSCNSSEGSMPVVARLNSVVCACKSKQCRVDAVDACVFDTATLASSSVFTPLAKLLRKRAHTSRTHTSRIESSLPGLHSPRLEWGRCRCRSPALARATRGTWRRRGVTSTGPHEKKSARGATRAGSSYRRSRPQPHLGSTDPGARREQKAATAPTRRETPKGCRRADADPGQPHAAAARRGKQQAA